MSFYSLNVKGFLKFLEAFNLIGERRSKLPKISPFWEDDPKSQGKV
jgi:hypothetical protein